MSKPMLPAKKRRSEKVQLRFSPDEMRFIQALAKQAGEPYLGTWLAALILIELRATRCSHRGQPVGGRCPHCGGDAAS